MKQTQEEKAFKEILKLAIDLKEQNFSYSVREMFFESFPNIDFEYLKIKSEENGFHIAKASELTDINKEYYSKLWNERKALIIFYNRNNL